MRMTALIIVLAIAAVFLAACEAMQSRTAQLGATLVTMQVIERASDPADKAARISRAVDAVEQHLEAHTHLSVSSLEAYALTYVDRNRLAPSEVLLWEEAVRAVADDLRGRVSTDGLLTAEGRAGVTATIAAIRRAIELEGY